MAAVLPPEAIVNVTTEAGDLEVTFCPSGTSGFDDLRRDAIDIEAGDRLHVLVTSRGRDPLEPPYVVTFG